MTTKDNDTDPSTPSARRSGPPPRVAPSTDPGVGPPGQRRSPSGRPIGVVVPPATVRIPGPAAVPAEARIPVTAKKDSVELLLDGMSGPRPDRTKTTPQTGGEASAAYHAEHSVHPGHSPHNDAPKVLVERPSTPRAIPVQGSAASQARRAPTVTGLNPPRGIAGDPTFVTPRDLRRRVVLAAVAGILVVLGLVMVLQITMARGGSDIPVLTASSARPAVEPSGRVAQPEPVAPPAAAQEQEIAPAVAAAEPTPPPASAPVESAVASAGKIAPPAAPSVQSAPSHKRRSKPQTSPGAPPASDLGEFKTSF